jgi:hypothetical protein
MVPSANTAKYLWMTLDAKLRWKAHIKKRQWELQIQFREMYWLLGCRSQLSMYNKLLLYKQVLRPVGTFGVQPWGCLKKSNIDIAQRYQNKVLRCLVNAPWYARNSDIHRDLTSVSKQSHPSLRDMRSHTDIVISIASMKRLQCPGFSMCNI